MLALALATAPRAVPTARAADAPARDANAERAAPDAADANELLDRSRDRILLRAPITSRGRTHGEVRLIERGAARVVQTLLYSKVLRRVLAAIRERERANWSTEREGHEASARYLAALERAEQSTRPAPDAQRSATADRRRALLIEFAVSDTREGVALLEPELGEADGALSIQRARLIEALELPRQFIRENMRLIAEEHLATQPDVLARMLAPPGSTAGERANEGGTGDITP